ncbi:MAG: 5'-nucleotidase C-terminal domain-containing protein [Prevotella sp.]
MFTAAAFALLLAMTAACSSGTYGVTGITRSRILVDARYDTMPDARAAALIEPYRQVVDSMMCPVMGTSAKYMSADRPESELSNLLADILVWAGKDYGEKPVVGVYNMGGIRASLPKGNVTYGDVLEVAPFENKICFVTLKGGSLMKLFAQMAATGGEGVSRGVELLISSDHRLLSARLNGKEIDPDAEYRIATIDYLAQGNDKMTALTEGYDLNSPKEESNDTRYIISAYFKAMAAQGKAVDSNIEGRIRKE